MQSQSIQIGHRDVEILNSLERCPLTTQQIMKLSHGFVSPSFSDESNVRRRLRALQKAKLINGWQYAIAGNGRSPNYFKLTRDGFRILRDQGTPLPNRRFFESIRPAHHWHTFCLAEFIVHLSVCAKRHGCVIESYARENSVALKAGVGTVYPDAAFVIRRSDARTFPFCIEIDNSTERVCSKLDVESIERKLQVYDAHNKMFAAHAPDRYLVLFVATRSGRRLQHIMQAANSITQQPERTVFTGCTLDTFLECDPFVDAVFGNHRGLRRALLPTVNDRLKNKESVQRKQETVLPCNPAGRPLPDGCVRA